MMPITTPGDVGGGVVGRLSGRDNGAECLAEFDGLPGRRGNKSPLQVGGHLAGGLGLAAQIFDDHRHGVLTGFVILCTDRFLLPARFRRPAVRPPRRGPRR